MKGKTGRFVIHSQMRMLKRKQTEVLMDKMQKDALQATKEIVVKFIETGRISPSNFGDIFPVIYSVVLDTVMKKAEEFSSKTETE